MVAKITALKSCSLSLHSRDQGDMEKSDCHWVSYHTRQRILSAIALTVEALGIGDAIKNAMQKDPAPLILKVCINQTQKDMITIT